MTFGCGIVIAALVTLLFKSNPQGGCLILNIILQATVFLYFNELSLSIQVLVTKQKIDL
jgi:hypothetical protein